MVVEMLNVEIMFCKCPVVYWYMYVNDVNGSILHTIKTQSHFYVQLLFKVSLNLVHYHIRGQFTWS